MQSHTSHNPAITLDETVNTLDSFMGEMQRIAQQSSPTNMIVIMFIGEGSAVYPYRMTKEDNHVALHILEDHVKLNDDLTFN